MAKIKVSYLLSYDYDMFLTSVKQLYEDVDKIVVGIDEDYLTWSGNKFMIPDEFFEEVKNFDKRNIIEFYFDKFYIPALSSMECESRERNMVLKKLGNGWKIQLDVDEYFYDFRSVSQYLKKYSYLTYFPRLTPICISARLITLFKKNETGYFIINNNEYFTFITNLNINKFTRSNPDIFNAESKITLIHDSWARSEQEIEIKISNWGHKNDFDTKSFFNRWKSIDERNFKDLENFHPIAPPVWDKLIFFRASSIDELIEKYQENKKQAIQNIDLFLFMKNIIHRLIYR